MQDLMPCPCCGHLTVKKPFWMDEEANTIHIDGKAISMRPLDAQIMLALTDVWPRTARREFIMDRLYGNDPNGGPCCDRSVDVRMVLIRKQLKSTRLRIETVRGSGFCLKVGEGKEHG